MRDYRARLRALGLRPIQLWIPDTRTPAFAAEARRQSELIAASEIEAEDLAFMRAVADDVFALIDRDEAR
jgi:hypothetical protein